MEQINLTSKGGRTFEPLEPPTLHPVVMIDPIEALNILLTAAFVALVIAWTIIYSKFFMLVISDVIVISDGMDKFREKVFFYD